MKKILIILATLLVLFVPVSAIAGTFELGFEWDANVETFCTGYRLYIGDQPGGPYTPVVDIDGRLTNEVYHTFETPDGVQTIKYFVVTALATENRESDYSNEVNWTFDFTPMPAATELAASYAADTIEFIWKQSAIKRTKRWTLYRSEVSGSGYEKILDIDYNGVPGEQYSETVSMVVPEGEKKTYYFVLITESTQGVKSADSNEVVVVIDKQVIVPVLNFKLKVKAQ